MRRPVKITLISLCSLLAVLVIAVVAVSQIVFNKDRLTPLVKQYAAEYVTCETQIGDIELTFFSSFPNVAICINDVAIVNPMDDAPNDTVLLIKRLFAKVDVMDYLKNDQITITGFTLEESQANLFVNADSVANYDIVALDDTEETDTTSTSVLDKMSLHNIEIQNLSASFVDLTNQMEARCRGVNLSLDTDASLQMLTGGGDIDLEAGEVYYSDTLNYASIINLKLKKSRLFYDGKDASVNVPQLSIESQEYLLSGDLSLLAKIWGMELENIDLQWKDGHPFLEGTTVLDSSEVTLGDEDLMYISTKRVDVDMPVTSTPELWTTHAKTAIQALSFAMDSEGTLADHLDVATEFTASTDSAFTDFVVKDMKTTVGSQRLEGYAHVNIADTTVTKADVDMTLGSTTLKDVLALVPESYSSALKGILMDARLESTQVKADCEVRESGFALKNAKLKTAVHSLDYSDDTNLSASFDDLTLGIAYPAGTRGNQIEINSVLSGLKVEQADDTSHLEASIPQTTVQTLVRDDVIDGKDPRLALKFDVEHLDARMDDTIQVQTENLKGSADVDMRSIKNCIKIDTKTHLSALTAQVGNSMNGSTGAVGLNLLAVYDEKQQDVLDMLSPEATFTLNDGKFQVEGVPYDILLPEVQASFNKNQATLSRCQLNIGNSDLGLKGVVSNINDYLKEKALLKGELDLTSNCVDADQLMDLVSGFGSDSTEVEEASMEPITADTTVADPFMVPKDVNFVVNTNVKTVTFNENSFNDVKGLLTCDDGILVLEQMGFTSKAADMQLTALYKSPRRNNLFVGWNFHLLNIDIAEMIRLVPEIDTIVPMLSSFQGKAEFHLAGESNLFADYSPKMSTLKAVAAIEGKDLTILDSETFETIKKYLFKESTTNKIDTLSVELAIARKKMTLYPMLVGWDKYEAIIAGNHTIVDAMPFNYNISITKCPLVGGHLGLDIKGNLDDVDNISFKLGSCKYANLYRPEKRNVTQSQTLELKNLISTSLKRMVKTEEKTEE
ncbi:MAG: hypothetical protein IJP70_02270 [Bacteroidales bacterium]|nr:hypothetical protein [Bacteroidales bacterium]